MDDTKPQPLLISGLVKHRRDLAAKLDHHQQLVQQLRAEIITVDGTIRSVDPEFDFGTIKRKLYRSPLPEDYRTFQFDLVRILRESDHYLSVGDICAQLPNYKFDELSPKDRRVLRDRVKGYLYRQMKKGRVHKQGANFKLLSPLVIDESPD